MTNIIKFDEATLSTGLGAKFHLANIAGFTLLTLIQIVEQLLLIPSQTKMKH